MENFSEWTSCKRDETESHFFSLVNNFGNLNKITVALTNTDLFNQVECDLQYVFIYDKVAFCL